MSRAGAALALLLLAGAAAAGAGRRDEIDLLNVALGPRYASWLIGAPGELASDQEVAEYQRLTRDEDAKAWIDEFWARRDPDPELPGNPVRKLAEERSEEADRRFTEAGIAGRRTDRGLIFVLYGEPDSIEHEPSPVFGDPALELWNYPRGAERGLDGERPDRLYRFAKRERLTEFYLPGRPKPYTQRRPEVRPR